MSSAKYLSESYWFKNNFSKSSAFIINDNYENFIIGLGNPSFLQKFHDLNLN